MSAAATTDWAAVYKSLDLDVLKRIYKWLTLAIPVVGALPVAAAFLVFKNQPGIGVILTLVVFIFSVQKARKLYLLNRKPYVYSGIVTGKNLLSYRQSKAGSTTYKYFVRIYAQEVFEIDIRGKADPLSKGNKPVKLRCSKELYLSMREGQLVTALILPHEKTIFRLLS